MPSRIPVIAAALVLGLAAVVLPDDAFAQYTVAVAPGRIISSEMSDGTRATLESKGITVTSLDYEPCWSSGGGMRCNTAPLARDPV